MTRIPLSWLSEYVDVPDSATAESVGDALVSVGLEEEAIHRSELTGPVVVGEVLSFTPEPQKNGKTINWCSLDVGEEEPRGIVCGAHNFAVGDKVVVALPGAVLPGDFVISARKTYGHISDGMMCSAAELGLGDDHSGIIVLSPELAQAAAGEDALDLLGLNEDVLEVNVTPDRGYCLSMRGIAREYWHATGRNFVDPAREAASNADKATKNSSDAFEVKIAETAEQSPISGRVGCDRFVARVVRGVDASRPSPEFMARRLHQAGMRPISLAVDVTNYVMLELGQPLHAYDLADVSEPIVVRRANEGESITTIDDVQRSLKSGDLVISDSPDGNEGGRILGLAGVMGGAESEVDDNTTDLVIEAAHFDEITVARTSRRLRLTSEASKRFERGVDSELPPAAVQRTVDLLVEHGGGVADEAVTDIDQREDIGAFEFSISSVARTVGVEYSPGQIKSTLEDVGCQVDEVDESADAQVWRVTPPSWRPDIQSDVDLSEEVARIHGYDQIPSVLPPAPAGTGLTANQHDRRLLSQTLAQNGLTEVLSYPFVGNDVLDALQYPRDDKRRRALQIINPLREEEPFLRTTILSTLLSVLRRNVGRGIADTAIFETGLVTNPKAEGQRAPIPELGQFPGKEVLAAIEAALPDQPVAIAGAMTGNRIARTPHSAQVAYGYADAISLSIRLAQAVGVTLRPRASEKAPWHPGRCAQLVTDTGAVVGYAGELHPKVIAALDLPQRTVAFELDVDALLDQAPREPVTATPVSTFPAGREDLAFVVAESTPASDVIDAVQQGAGELVEKVHLFDVYRGPQIGENEKSLAIAIRYRAGDRTLTSEDLLAARQRAIAKAEQECNAKLRA